MGKMKWIYKIPKFTYYCKKTKLGEIYVDKTAISGETYTYVVTAVDRLHNESVASSKSTIQEIKVRAPIF